MEQLVREFLAPYPVELYVDPELAKDRYRNETPSRLEVRDGKLHMASGESLAKLNALWGIRAHEIGHVIAATDEELFAPNLGLPTVASVSLEADDIKRTEYGAIVSQVTFMKVAGRHGHIDRLLRLTQSLFDLDPKEVKRRVKNCSIQKLHKQFGEQMTKIGERPLRAGER